MDYLTRPKFVSRELSSFSTRVGNYIILLLGHCVFEEKPVFYFEDSESWKLPIRLKLFILSLSKRTEDGLLLNVL